MIRLLLLLPRPAPLQPHVEERGSIFLHNENNSAAPPQAHSVLAGTKKALANAMVPMGTMLATTVLEHSSLLLFKQKMPSLLQEFVQ